MVVFADGTYLGFLNWYDPPPSLVKEKLPVRLWAPQGLGLLAFAITDTTRTAEESVSTVHDRLTAGPEKDASFAVTFGAPIAGSRRNAHGVEM
jgi:hypothetical protein